MKLAFLRPLGILLFLSAILAWLRGGMQVYYKSYYTVKRVDELLGIEYEEKVYGFLAGAETLFAGFFLMAICVLLASILERRSFAS